MANTRIIIADDHPIFREGLRKLLEAEVGFSVVGEAADGVTALDLTCEQRPDLLLLDVAMPRLSGLDVLRELSKMQVTVPTILLTVGIEKPVILEALKLGARGVVMKDSTIELIWKCIHAILDGQYWIGRESLAELVTVFQRFKRPKAAQQKPSFNLTSRELEVIATVAEGYTNKEIASRFLLSEETVKHHLTHIFDKLGVSNRVELALFAINHRLVVNS